MPRYDASQAELLVFTFKEGILSAMAHDLKLRATTLELETTETSVKLKVDASSLRVVSPMKDGAENPSALPRMLYAEIEKNTAGDVLNAKKFPAITFESTALSETQVIGKLTLHGTTRELTGKRTAKNTAEFSFDQRDFGIKPYSAMLGTLKVKPEVTIRVTIPG
ncbi:MAG: YceI family protein [Archangium sp.]|nr:YceI family protein [Archangium sp.]